MLIYFIIGVIVLLYSIQDVVESGGTYEVSAVDIVTFWGIISLWPVTVILLLIRALFHVDINRCFFKVGKKK